MRARPIATMTVGAILGLAGCSSGAPSAPLPQAEYAAVTTFCADVGVYASELTKGTLNPTPAPMWVEAFNSAAHRIDTTDPARPNMTTVAMAITSDVSSTLWPDVAKGQAYCTSADAAGLSGSPSSAP